MFDFWYFLDTLLLGPLRLLFELVFSQVYAMLGVGGWAIIALSVVMTLLLLPFYRHADILQKAAQEKEHSLRDGVQHIRKAFRGRERMMMLQTYYRQNDYKQTDALRGTMSLALEIPFFLAAYQFLSSLTLLKGMAFGVISDLAAPDALLHVGSSQLNLLPLLMTLFNVLSTVIFTRKANLKSKIQLYAMAAFFLVFLYNSPSGLLLYWTFNNLFSLIKNVLTAIPRRDKQKVAKRKRRLKEKATQLVASRATVHVGSRVAQRRLFLASGLFLTVLIGVLIPSTFIAASPQEYVDIFLYEHPLRFVLTSILMAAGFNQVWLPIFYKLSSDLMQHVLSRGLFIVAGASLANYMFFGNNLGIISSALQYENGLDFMLVEQLTNWFILVVLAILLVVFVKFLGKAAVSILLVASLALGAMSVTSFVRIDASIQQLDLASPTESNGEEDKTPSFTLSRNGKNVVVLMFDRALGYALPYLLNEKPGFAEQFAGFTYYANTISYGGSTNFGVPPLLGGYEYTPVEMNARDEEALVDKHNEALKVLPVLFADHGYQVTVCDPPYANYRWYPDLKIYDDYPDIEAMITKGRFSQKNRTSSDLSNNHRNFFLFSLMKTLPLSLQPQLYDEGNYRRLPSERGGVVTGTQLVYSLSKAQGFRRGFMESYDVLLNLSQMTTISDTEQGTFLFLLNDTTHEPMLLKAPGYVPAATVDNRTYDANNDARFVDKENDRALRVETTEQMTHYHVNMAMLVQLGYWLDSLRQAGVYDNTRIILVSDHGRDMGQIDELLYENADGDTVDVTSYYPLLMVKDFADKEFRTSDVFMTNADVPTLALQDLIPDPVNPFTGKPINSDAKTAHPQFIIMSHLWQTDVNNGNTFMPAAWASVQDDIYDAGNWNFYMEKQVLAEHVIAEDD